MSAVPEQVKLHPIHPHNTERQLCDIEIEWSQILVMADERVWTRRPDREFQQTLQLSHGNRYDPSRQCVVVELVEGPGSRP